MRDENLEAGAVDDLRAGVRVSCASLVWTVAASTAAVVLGVDAGSTVLVAFGATGLVDGLGSATLLVHFRHALRHEAVSERRERLALQLVTVGLAVVGLATAVESVERLLHRADARAAPAGVALAAVSVGVLALLAHTKHRIARRIPSGALRADGWLSATGCLLAVVTVAGTGVTAAFGWWWADPLAAFAVGCGAVAIAGVVWRAERVNPPVPPGRAGTVPGRRRSGCGD